MSQQDFDIRNVLLLKTLSNDNASPYQGFDYSEYLPTQDENGEWQPGPWLPSITDDLEMCAVGWHVTDVENLSGWWNPRVYVAEPGGTEPGMDKDYIGSPDTEKYAFRTMRLTRQVQMEWDHTVLMLCAAVEHALDETYHGPTFGRYANRFRGSGKEAWLRSVPGLLSQVEDLVREMREAVVAGVFHEPDTRPDAAERFYERANRIYNDLPSALDSPADIIRTVMGGIHGSGEGDLAEYSAALYQAMQISNWSGSFDSRTGSAYYMALFKDYLRAITTGTAGPSREVLLARTQPGFTATAEYEQQERERASWRGPVFTGTMTFYKTLQGNLTSPFQGFDYTSYLPTEQEDGWEPGAWLPPQSYDLVMCRHGWHLTDATHLTQWMNSRVYVAEVAGDPQDGALRIGVDIIGVSEDGSVEDTKVAVRSVRLVRPLTVSNERILGWALDTAAFVHDAADQRMKQDSADYGEGYIGTEQRSAFNTFGSLCQQARKLLADGAEREAVLALHEEVHRAYYAVSGDYDNGLAVLEMAVAHFYGVANHMGDTTEVKNLANNINERLCGHQDMMAWVGNRLVEWLSAEQAPEPGGYFTA